MSELYTVPSAAGEYERLNLEIEALRPSITAESSSLLDYNKLLVQRRQLWMRQNGLGPR